MVLLVASMGLAGQAPSVTTATAVATTEPLKAFGYDIFQGQVREVVEGPIDEDYIVGPRDELLVQTWGEYTKQYPVRVSEDGDFYLEGEEQRIFANGMTLRQLQIEITKRLAQIHEGYFNWQKPSESKAWVEVRAIRVRPILVYVVGEVVRPGTFSLNSTVASLINVLTNAGGVKPSGSLRHIRISRADGKNEDYDLYDFLIKGDTKAVKTRLKYGETIFIDLKRKSVEVRGHVRRPGLYEMLDSESLRDLLTYAGGPAPSAYLKRIQIVRRALNEGTRTLDVDFGALTDKGTTFALLDGDRVEVLPSVEEEYVVSLEGGGVFRPGTFQFTEGMTLTELIEKGEGLRGEAYLEKADLIRTRPDYTKEFRSFSLKELYKMNPGTGKVDLIGEKNSPLNFVLRRLDKIVVYSYYEIIGKDKKVKLEGHVKQPGEYLLAESMKLSNLLFAYGGFDDRDWRRATYQDRADLVRTRPDDLSTTIIAIALRRVLDGDPQADLALQSMDRIVVYSYDEIIKKDKLVRLEGHVKKTGEYPLSENMRLSDLLFAYGGFEDADFRKATYLERADLYRTNPNDLSTSIIAVPLGRVLAGDRQADLPLQSLDRVVVYEYKEFHPDSFFTIRGAVRKPGRYPLSQNTTLNDAIIAASGLLQEADYEAEVVRISPERVSALQPAEVFRVPISKDYASQPRSQAFRLVKDDSVFIRTVSGWRTPKTVRLTGEVQFAGEYVLARADERLSAVVERARGLKATAWLPGVVFTRRLDEDSTVGARVRVAIEIKRALARPSGPEDLILRDGDEIHVPINPMTVEVRGTVQMPAVLQYEKGRGIGGYIQLCGGYRKEARRRDVLVFNPNGTATRHGWGWFAPEPMPGSVIVVPPYLGLLEEAATTWPLAVERRGIPAWMRATDVSPTRPYSSALGRTAPGRIGTRAVPSAVATTGTIVVQNILAPPAAERPPTTSTLRAGAGSPFATRTRTTATTETQPGRSPRLPIP
jgi:protein involved in polysaccharide export with SLBB domain